jgi:hypothetical protein
VIVDTDNNFANSCTAPNQHSEMRRAICGGIVQEEGMRESLDALIEMVAVIALYFARLFQFDDLFEDLSQRFDGDQSPRDDAPPVVRIYSIAVVVQRKADVAS